MQLNKMKVREQIKLASFNPTGKSTNYYTQEEKIEREWTLH